MKRREAREKALQTLFQLDNSDILLEEAMAHIMEDKMDDFYEKLVRGTIEHKDTIDEKLKSHLDNWSLDRLPKIERTVLRLAVFEIVFGEDAPTKVVVNEAIELSKQYGDEQSSKFVNGVLSKLV